MMEKQNKELRDKVVELEELAKGRSKAVVANLEAKIAATEEQLHLEANEKTRFSRELRKTERKCRDMQTQVEEERKQADSYKEQVCDIVIGM
jgi:excinuclease UvrABC nuclease subunit